MVARRVSEGEALSKYPLAYASGYHLGRRPSAYARRVGDAPEGLRRLAPFRLIIVARYFRGAKGDYLIQQPTWCRSVHRQ